MDLNETLVDIVLTGVCKCGKRKDVLALECEDCKERVKYRTQSERDDERIERSRFDREMDEYCGRD